MMIANQYVLISWNRDSMVYRKFSCSECAYEEHTHSAFSPVGDVKIMQISEEGDGLLLPSRMT